MPRTPDWLSRWPDTVPRGERGPLYAAKLRCRVIRVEQHTVGFVSTG